ncbi:DUF3176 domain-containing protein [Aspergillus novofumigatus IBT 16806]|uniref:Uncharacterized protein n=1 Tax=Aspergillus novofumigatus (strain IBT 16806) TaxID=1392255 RepID=A0A2I1CEX3_ASPN1|nr:uncharacterized protein P174DRAFT_511784 [Aspergillus novofumigatus IBT 16806]PKX96175.1 hypothetical protein P174DRAFT_511784 [Aspergillus novofumigatus IBT 16806]
MQPQEEQSWQQVRTQYGRRWPCSSLRSNDQLDADAQPQQSPGAENASRPSPAVQDEKEQPPKSVESFVSDWYVWEVLAVLVSAGTLVAMVAMLIHYDHKPQPAWRLLSLNSVISWLSTISKACVLFSINECIGQLKWVWFGQRQQRVVDLQSFDTASRGFYGSAVLIWILKARHIAVWGSLAIILALAFDPFVQNLIHYYPNLVVDPSQTAFLPNSTRYDTVGLPGRGASRVDAVLKANVYSSLFNADQSKPWAIPQYLLASLGARAVCANVTDHLVPSCHNATYGPRGLVNCSLTLANSSTTIWFVPNTAKRRPLAVNPAVTSALEPLVYKNATLSPIQFIAARGITSERGGTIPNIDLNTKWEAIECSIEPVVQSIRARVENNIYSEDVLATWVQSNLTELRRTCKPNWGPELGAFPTQNFSLHVTALSAIDYFFKTIFDGSFEEDAFAAYYAPSQKSYAGSDVIEALATGNVSGCSPDAVDKFNCSMHNVAAAISKSFRDSAYISAGSDPGKAQMAAGRVMRSMTYVAVQWQWIVLPVLVWLLGVVTLVGTVWKTWRNGAPKWRNDPLPLLFLYREEKNDGVSDRDIKQRADNLKVKMYESGQKRHLGS